MLSGWKRMHLGEIAFSLGTTRLEVQSLELLSSELDRNLTAERGACFAVHKIKMLGF